MFPAMLIFSYTNSKARISLVTNSWPPVQFIRNSASYKWVLYLGDLPRQSETSEDLESKMFGFKKSSAAQHTILISQGSQIWKALYHI